MTAAIGPRPRAARFACQRRTSTRYSLVRAYSPYGTTSTRDLLEVGLTDNRISSFRTFIGAAGD